MLYICAFCGRLVSLEVATKPHKLYHHHHHSSSLVGFLASMSSISKTPSSNNMTSIESPEESGWTKYFEDFFHTDHNNNIIDDQKCSISFSGIDHSSFSFVSDAASLAAAKKFTNIAQAGSFKKRKKTRTTLVDDDLMDTASSPINSPKVLYENQFSKANEKEEMELYQDKGNSAGERDEGKELGFNERDSDQSELKKKGLCLVPLSIVTNYLG